MCKPIRHQKVLPTKIIIYKIANTAFYLNNTTVMRTYNLRPLLKIYKSTKEAVERKTTAAMITIVETCNTN